MDSFKKILPKLIILCTVFTASFCDLKTPFPIGDILSSGAHIGECKACKIFIESFKTGLERTERGKFEGGDAAWEEEKLKVSYKRSELRLVDIQEGICKEVIKHADQCHSMAEKAEEFIEEWWSNGNLDDTVDLHNHICIEKLKVCCPKHHYGKECKPCPGDHNNLCSGNGICRGDGTRKGNGTCLCDSGYTGQNCDQCMTGYYKQENDGKTQCYTCHFSCMGGCTGGSNKDCVACKPGYERKSDGGCVDINECDQKNICKKNEFCLNSLGAYTCKKCDKACKSCHGDGPDLCRKCAPGYSKQGEICIADREDEDLHSTTLRNTRYISYVGLLVATGILIPSSTSLGSVIGALVLSYIVGAEYYCMINNFDGLMTMKDFDWLSFIR